MQEVRAERPADANRELNRHIHSRRQNIKLHEENKPGLRAELQSREKAHRDARAGSGVS